MGPGRRALCIVKGQASREGAHNPSLHLLGLQRRERCFLPPAYPVLPWHKTLGVTLNPYCKGGDYQGLPDEHSFRG